MPKIHAVGYDEFGFAEDPWAEEVREPVEAAYEAPSEPHIPMREVFPPAGSEYSGGSSDGYEYRSAFAGSTLAHTYSMIRDFLKEEGYGDLPLPETAESLRLFKRPRHPQLMFFEERGYIHNPVKILFPDRPARKNTLVLVICNEKAERHLERFHGVV